MKYITVSLVSVLGSSVGSVSSYSSGPKIDPRVQNIFGANVSLSVTGGKNTGKVPSQRESVVQKLTVPTYEGVQYVMTSLS